MRYFGFILGLLWASSAFAQQATPVTPTPTNLQASTTVCATAPAVNATQSAGTCTLTGQNGLYIYINYLQVGACGDNAAVAANTPQLAFTSTNLGGWQQQFTFMQGGTTQTTGVDLSCQYVGGPRYAPLKSAQPGVNVTIVPPAQQAHTSYPINVEYYYAQ